MFREIQPRDSEKLKSLLKNILNEFLTNMELNQFLFVCFIFPINAKKIKQNFLILKISIQLFLLLIS